MNGYSGFLQFCASTNSAMINSVSDAEETGYSHAEYWNLTSSLTLYKNQLKISQKM
jgi:hypothetical protein